MFRRRLGWWAAAGIFAALAVAGMAPEATAQTDAAPSNRLMLTLRARVDSPGLGGASRVVETAAAWDPRRTAIIVCDMWDLHHCLNAIRRVGEIGPEDGRGPQGRPRAGRHRSSTPRAVAWTPTRTTPPASAPRTRPRSKSLPDGDRPVVQADPRRGEGRLPDRPARRRRGRRPRRTRPLGRPARRDGPQPPRPVEVADRRASRSTATTDYISDNGEEIWSILEDRGIDNVILMGVHLNMCVLGRPFGLRQMAKNGKNVVLMRDMTDTMYNPRKRPVRQPLHGHRPDGRARREVRLPDDHQRPAPRRQAVPLQGRHAGRTSPS